MCPSYFFHPFGFQMSTQSQTHSLGHMQDLVVCAATKHKNTTVTIIQLGQLFQTKIQFATFIYCDFISPSSLYVCFLIDIILIQYYRQLLYLQCVHQHGILVYEECSVEPIWTMYGKLEWVKRLNQPTDEKCHRHKCSHVGTSVSPHWDQHILIASHVVMLLFVLFTAHMLVIYYLLFPRAYTDFPSRLKTVKLNYLLSEWSN